METLSVGGGGEGEGVASLQPPHPCLKNIVPSKQDNRSAPIMLHLWICVGKKDEKDVLYSPGSLFLLLLL